MKHLLFYLSIFFPLASFANENVDWKLYSAKSCEKFETLADSFYAKADEIEKRYKPEIDSLLDQIVELDKSKSEYEHFDYYFFTHKHNLHLKNLKKTQLSLAFLQIDLYFKIARTKETVLGSSITKCLKSDFESERKEFSDLIGKIENYHQEVIKSLQSDIQSIPDVNHF